MSPARSLSSYGLTLGFAVAVRLLSLALAGFVSVPSNAQASEPDVIASAKSEIPWELAVQQDGIDVFTRPVNGSGIREFMAEAEVNASLHTIDTLLHNAHLFKTWFPSTPKSELLKREGDVSYQYSVLKTPWPLSDRDNVLRAVTKRDPETGTVRITVVAAPDAHPEQADYVRVRKAKGLWVLEPIGESKTRILFQMHLEPGGGIPQWLINASVVDTPLEAISNLRETVNPVATQ